MSGQSPNDTASVLNSTTVCNSVVHIIDKVLLPTDSLTSVPAPGNGLNSTASAALAGNTTSGPLFPGLTCVPSMPGHLHETRYFHVHCTESIA